jgi:hypothetical protein
MKPSPRRRDAQASISGISAPPTEPCWPFSEATMPSMMPVPELFGMLGRFFAVA